MSFDNSNLRSGNWAVRIYMLNSKQSKADSTKSALAAQTLLDNGNGTTQDWNPTATNVVVLSQLPISKENFSGHYKEFKFAKDSGAMNADASTPPPCPNGAKYATNHQFTWHWKHKGVAKYDENGNFPTNYCPMWCIVAFPYDGYNVTGIENAPIFATVRTEMYYKDM